MQRGTSSPVHEPMRSTGAGDKKKRSLARGNDHPIIVTEPPADSAEHEHFSSRLRGLKAQVPFQYVSHKYCIYMPELSSSRAFQFNIHSSSAKGAILQCTASSTHNVLIMACSTLKVLFYSDQTRQSDARYPTIIILK